MKRYIDAEKLKKAIEDKGLNCSFALKMERLDILALIDSLQQEQQEVDLEKFTEKMDDWKARYNHPDNIPIKATMAFTARMFYQYPNTAREWYESLPKATMD